MLTNAAKYSVRATIYLAVNSKVNNKMSAKMIAEELEVPTPFLAKLLQQLSKSLLVSSTKGPNGGFYLSDTNSKKSIWDVIHCIDGTEKFDGCFLGLHTCTNENPCSVHSLVTEFRKKLKQQFKDKNIKQVAQEIIECKEPIQFDF